MLETIYKVINEAEQQFSANVMEVIAVVWGVTHYRNCLFGAPFKISTGHKALLVCLSEEKSSKTTQTRLVCWFDMFLPFDFEIRPIPGKKLGFC